MSESRLDRMLRESFEDIERDRLDREAKRLALVDPFKKPRTEPGRALPGHGIQNARRTSLGGEHS